MRLDFAPARRQAHKIRIRPYWAARGLEMVFLGNRLLWSRRTGDVPLTATGGPKSTLSKFGLVTGFGATSGSGTTDRLDGGVLPRPASGWRSIVSHYYANSTGAGGLGRIFQDASGTGVQAGEMLANQGGQMGYAVYATTAYGLYTISSGFATGRWQSFGVTHNQTAVATAPTFYHDGIVGTTNTTQHSAGSFQTTPCNLVFGNRASDGARNWDGLIGPTLIFDGALSAADHAVLNKNTWAIIDTDDWLAFAQDAIGSPVLTNNLATTASGIVVPSLSLGLSNNLAISAVETLTPVISQALVNTLSTTATGSLGTTAALVNNLTTSATGGLIPSISKALTDNLSTTAAGALAATLSITLANNVATTDVGLLTLTGNYSAALSNNLATTTTGSLTPVVTTTVSNNLATTASGDLSPKLALALLNNALASDVGSIAAGVSLTLANNLATSVSGNLAVFYNATLSNNLVTTSQGILTPKISKVLSGVAATAVEGAVGILGYNAVVGLSGQAVEARTGLLSVFAPNEIVFLNSFLTTSIDLQSRIFT